MNKVIEYKVSYDLEVDIRYLGEESPGEHYFSLHRYFPDRLFDDEDEEAKAVVTEEGTWNIEGYEQGYLREEEEGAINEMMKEIIKSKT